MTTKLKGIAAAGLFALAALNPAAAQNSALIPVYTTYYYADDSYQILVGTISGDCRWGGWNGPYVQYRLWGVLTANSYEELSHYCGPNGQEPI